MRVGECSFFVPSAGEKNVAKIHFAEECCTFPIVALRWESNLAQAEECGHNHHAQAATHSAAAWANAHHDCSPHQQALISEGSLLIPLFTMSSAYLETRAPTATFHEIPMDTIMAFIDDFDLVALDKEANNAIWADLMQTPLIQVDSPPAQPALKPKRIRREVVELRYLRQEVVALEQKLSQFQQAKDQAGDASIVSDLWKQVATQRIVERTNAELENERLKNRLSELAQMRQALEMLIAQQSP